MRNYVQRGDTLTVSAPHEVSSGDGVVIGALFGIANGDAELGAPLDLDVLGVFALPKVSALAIGLGELVYWDNTNEVVTRTSAGNTKIGIAAEAALNPSATVNVRLSGAF